MNSLDFYLALLFGCKRDVARVAGKVGGLTDCVFTGLSGALPEAKRKDGGVQIVNNQKHKSMNKVCLFLVTAVIVATLGCLGGRKTVGNEDVEKKIDGVMTMKTTAGVVMFGFIGTGAVTFCWGDGSEPETWDIEDIIELDEEFGFGRAFADTIMRWITITGTNITGFKCANNEITELDVSRNKVLTALWCGGNRLTEIDVSQNRELLILCVIGNDLTSLDVSWNTALTSLSCSYNQLTALDVRRNTALTSLSCAANQLTVLDVSRNTALIELWCPYNQLTVLDISRNTALTSLNCRDNQLTALDLSRNTALIKLQCQENKLINLNLRQNVALSQLNCSNNQLTALCVGSPALKHLECNDNRLTSLDVSLNTALETLYCRGNLLTILDVSRNVALRRLYCDYNRLTELDFTQNTRLQDLYITNNQFTAAALDALFETLHDNLIAPEFILSDEVDNYFVKIIGMGGNLGTADCDPSIAERKGWTVRR